MNTVENWVDQPCIQEPFEKNNQGKTLFQENANYYLDDSQTVKINFGYVSKHNFDESFVILNVLNKSPDEWHRDPLLEIDNIKKVYNLFHNHGYKPLTIEVSYEDIHIVSPNLKDIIENKKIQSFTVDCLSRRCYYMAEYNEKDPIIVYQL